jgi:hypothetical protein
MGYTNLPPNQDVDENGLIFEVGSLYVAQNHSMVIHNFSMLFDNYILPKLPAEQRSLVMFYPWLD